MNIVDIITNRIHNYNIRYGKNPIELELTRNEYNELSKELNHEYSNSLDEFELYKFMGCVIKVIK